MIQHLVRVVLKRFYQCLASFSCCVLRIVLCRSLVNASPSVSHRYGGLSSCALVLVTHPDQPATQTCDPINDATTISATSKRLHIESWIPPVIEFAGHNAKTIAMRKKGPRTSRGRGLSRKFQQQIPNLPPRNRLELLPLRNPVNDNRFLASSTNLQSFSPRDRKRIL